MWIEKTPRQLRVVRGMTATGFSPAVRELIKDRAGREGEYVRCEYCQYWIHETAIQLHHRRARKAGGSKAVDTNLPSNGVGLCSQCHYLHEARRERAYATGWLLRYNDSPAAVPLIRPDGTAFLLSDDGLVVSVPAPVGDNR